MAETINSEDYKRGELDKMAEDLGLVDAKNYTNKPAVADAINRVNGGEDATAVNAELAPSGDDSGDSPEAKPAAPASDAPSSTDAGTRHTASR